ncbi:fimbria/pilus outer membrane usher protein [Erwinia sp. CGal63]|uniref:fimbria/pilus outer membrane usher protein n=1 Tax=Erwinia sp. CGal63 TaxID=2919889 RepID=UPI00300BBCA7
MALLLGALSLLNPAISQASDGRIAHFNSNRLKALGIDPAVAAYFSEAGRFSPGFTEVELYINGDSLGARKLTFGPRGELCADEAFYASAGIQRPASLQQKDEGSDLCPSLQKQWPTASVTLLPSEQEVRIVVPQKALARENNLTGYQRGGTAALMNYSAYHSQFSFSGNRSDFSYLNLETGFNSNDWMVRGMHNLVQSSDGGTRFNTPFVYAQKTLVDRKQLLQAGQINFSNPLLSGAAIDGIQLIPQTALNGAADDVQVSGIARAEQSRVEIRQNGILIYSTLVPVGPFTLTKIPVLNYSNDLQLSVIAPDGQQENSVVSAASFRRLVAKAPESWSLALGRMRALNVDDGYERPWVASFSDGWNLSRQLLLEAGTLVGSSYQGGGAGVTFNPLPEVALGLGSAFSQDRTHDKKGARSNVSMMWQTSPSMSVGGDITLYSPGYRELIDSTNAMPAFYNRTSASLRVGWREPVLGNFSFAASQSRLGDDSMDVRQLTAAWNRQFGVVNASLNWQRQSHSTRQCDNGQRCRNSDRESLFASLNFPLGTQRVNTYYRDTQNSAVAGLQTGNTLTENSSWSLTAERQLRQQRFNSLAGNLNGNLHYTTASLYGQVAENHVHNYSGTLSGGVVAHKEGIVFSPEKVNETFGVISVEPAVSGVEFITPQGKTWTDWRGKAVIPSLPAYATGRIELNTERLPENTDVSNGLRQILAGHGAVTDARFTLQRTRNGLLTVALAEGSLLPKGSVIVTSEEEYVTTAVDAGTVFITNLDDKRPLIARWQDRQCRLRYSVPEKAPQGVGYEKISAVCD